MNAVWCVQTNPGMMMLVVVPVEERAAEDARVLDRTKPLGKLGPVLHSPELRFRKRVVIGDIGPRMRFGDSKIGQKLRDKI